MYFLITSCFLAAMLSMIACACFTLGSIFSISLIPKMMNRTQSGSIINISLLPLILSPLSMINCKVFTNAKLLQ